LQVFTPWVILKAKLKSEGISSSSSLACICSYLCAWQVISSSETLACCLTSKPGKHSSVASFFPLGKKFHLASILSLQQPPIPDCATTISKTSPFSLLAAAAAAEEEEEEKEELVL